MGVRGWNVEICLRLRLAGGNPGGIGDMAGVAEDTLGRTELEDQLPDETVFGTGGSAAGGNAEGGTTIAPFIAVVEDDAPGDGEPPTDASLDEGLPTGAKGTSSVVATPKSPGTGTGTCANV